MSSRTGVAGFFRIAGMGLMVLGGGIFLMGIGLSGEGALGASISASVFFFIGLIWWVVGNGVGFYYQRAAKQQAEERRLFQSGRRATAVIEAVEPTATTINNMPVVWVTVRVDAKFGRPFTHRRKIVTPASAIPVPGHLVEAAYDPSDQSKVALETQPGFSGLPGVVLKTRPAPEGYQPPPADEQQDQVAAVDPPADGPGDEQLDRLERLAKLHKAGVLTDAEFAEQKTRLLNGG